MNDSTETDGTDQDKPLFDRLAFASSAEGPWAIYTMRADGSRSLLVEDYRPYSDMPAWSHDGNRIAFTRAGMDLLVVSAEGGSAQVVPVHASSAVQNPPEGGLAPCWSPDGEHIAFIGTQADHPSRWGLFTIALDGSDLRSIGPASMSMGAPSWCPVNDIIAVPAFDMADGEGPYVFRVRPDGSDWTQVSDIPAEGRPAWSPAGTQIAFSGSDGRIWIVEADGSSAMPVGDKPLGFQPMWVPGGSHVAYSFASGTGDWIYVCDIHGNHPRPLLDDAKDPAFSPLLPAAGVGRAVGTAAVGSHRWAATARLAPSPGQGTVTVAAEIDERLRGSRPSVLLQLRDASDANAAMAALEASRPEIYGLVDIVDGDFLRPSASPPLPSPSGPLMQIDGGTFHPEVIAEIPGIVVRHLVEYGVSGALVAMEDPSPPRLYAPVLGVGPVLYLHPDADPSTRTLRWRVTMPEHWVEVACRWVTSGLASDAPVRIGVGAVQARLPADDLLAVARHCHRVGRESVAQAGFSFVAGEAGGVLRGVHASFMGSQWLELGAGTTGDEGVQLELFDELTDIAEELSAETAYSFISFDAPVLLSPPQPTGRPDAAPHELVQRHCDEIVLDAYPYQVLGPGHLQRLGSAGRSSESIPSRALLGGRIGVALGAPSDWLLDRAERQQRARELLAPCLLTTDEARSEL